jgi:uncharacterized membrane-anchored protein YitT (DUF2179 family)
MAISFNVFFRAHDLVTGGISGLAIILEDAYNLQPDVFIFISNLVLFILGYVFMGKDFAIKTVVGTFSYPWFISLTENIPMLSQDLFISTIYGAALVGIGLGLIFKSGGSTGGADIPPQIFHKYFHISVAQGILIIDGLVIVAGAYFYDIERALYAVIAMFISAFVIDRVLLGFAQSKAIYIISEKQDVIKEFILNDISRGLTIYKAKGGFTDHDKNVLMCVVDNRQYTRLKNTIHELDEKAFLIVTNATEVFGEGF